MRIKQKALVNLTCLILASLLLTTATAQPEASNQLEFVWVSKKVARIQERIPLSDSWGVSGAYYRVNVYAVKTRGGVVLVDCGDDDLAGELLQLVEMEFRKPVLAVYLTHYHSDHAGGGAYLQSQGIPIYSPAIEAPLIAQGGQRGETPPEFTYPPYTPDGVYGEIELFKWFKVVEEPGHTLGNVALEYRHGRTRYLFSSDTLLHGEEYEDPLDMTWEVTYGTAYQNYLQSPQLYHLQLATLTQMVETLPAYDYVLTGHGSIISGEEAAARALYTIGILQSFQAP